MVGAMWALALCAFLAVFNLNSVKPGIEVTELPQTSEGQSCGGDITAENGTIQSPNYPQTYGRNESCLWKITVPENFRIRLYFSRFDLEFGGTCEFDYVEVFDGHDPGSEVLRKLCGLRYYETVLSSGNKMAVKFSSDGTEEGSGFLAQFRKVSKCGGNIVAEEGVIQSPNYPNNYWVNDICIWKITVPEDKAVLLRFKDFQTEASENCMYDYVDVLDGHDPNSAYVIRRCGLYTPSENPLEIRSLGHKITVKFVSDVSKGHYGFLAEFQTVEITEPSHSQFMETASLPVKDGIACMKAIDYDKGTLVSPHYPEYYKSNEECTWTIKGSPGSRINLMFKMFELVTSGTCSFDYVTVRDSYESSLTSLRMFCGPTSPGLITSSGNVLTVSFKSDGSGERQGFTALFNASEGAVIKPDLTEEVTCGEDITSDEGIIQSPNYPENYGPNQKCLWKITVPSDHPIILKFNEFKVEKHIRCAYDYVLVRDGHTPQSPVLAKFCGTEIPAEVRSCQNKLMIEFHSDSSVEHTGFSAEFKKDLSLAVTKEPSPELGVCGGDIVAESGTIQSPNYPEPYGHLENCTWKITAPKNRVVGLNFDAIDLEYSTECNFDKVTLLDGDNVYSPVISTLCEYSWKRYLSSENQMTVQFTSDDSFEKTGFRATFRSVALCGEHITADKGVIQSPNISDAYQCSWRITVPETYSVVLKIHKDTKKYFSLRSFDVEIHDQSKNKDLRFYSLDQERNVRFDGNEMFVSVFSDGSNRVPRFYAEFEKEVPGAVPVSSEDMKHILH